MHVPAPRRKGKQALDDNWRIPDGLWEQIQPLLPPVRPKPKGGRPRMWDRPAMDAIFYVLRKASSGSRYPGP